MSISISIHAPHTGRDGILTIIIIGPFSFQSTRPIRGATKPLVNKALENQFQSTRPIRGATLIGVLGAWLTAFQSTRPIRGATFAPQLGQ